LPSRSTTNALREAFIDGSFAPAKKGGAGVGTTKRGKGSKIMAIADRHGRPVAIHIDSATPHEVTLVEATLAHRLVQKTPERLIGDNAYESDQLDAELAHRGIELIAPHRGNRTRRTQDGRRSAGIDADGRWNGCLRGCRTIDGSSCGTNAPGEFPGHVAVCLLADLAAGVYEMTSSSGASRST
jgi:Transposase DDE domain